MTGEVTYFHTASNYLTFSCIPQISWEDERQVSKQEGMMGITNDPQKCLRIVKVNSYIATDDVLTIHKYMQPDAAIDYNDWTIVGAALGYDEGVGYTDETTDANDAGANDVVLLPAVPAVNDAFYIGMTTPVSGIVIDVGTAGIGTWTVTWEYCDGSDSWAALENVIDDTVGFTVEGENHVTWTIPPDWWGYQDISTYNDYFWVRGRVSAYTSVNEQPLADQIYLLGRYPYLSVTLASGDVMLFPCIMSKPTATKSNEEKYHIAVTFMERTL